MDIKTGFFYLFSVVLLFAAFRVITARNPVYAALYLVLAFFQAAAVWILLKAEFLAISLVLVYVGAVMVLFLFVVMMLDINVDSLRAGFWKHFPLAATVGAVIALEMAAVLMGGFRLGEDPKAVPAAAAEAAAQVSNTKELGKL
ncbi:MAG: NADH-quinone oxidoreductase subunit J, partial [Ramlibacter sp.]